MLEDIIIFVLGGIAIYLIACFLDEFFHLLNGGE